MRAVVCGFLLIVEGKRSYLLQGSRGPRPSGLARHRCRHPTRVLDAFSVTVDDTLDEPRTMPLSRGGPRVPPYPGNHSPSKLPVGSGCRHFRLVTWYALGGTNNN